MLPRFVPPLPGKRLEVDTIVADQDSPFCGREFQVSLVRPSQMTSSRGGETIETARSSRVSPGAHQRLHPGRVLTRTSYQITSPVRGSNRLPLQSSGIRFAATNASIASRCVR